MLISVECSTPDLAYRLFIEEINDVTGDAEITMNRGKRKHVCDFDVTLKWGVESDAGRCRVGSGSMIIRDVNAEKEYDVQVSVDSSSSGDVGSLGPFIKSSDLGLQKAIFSTFDVFFTEFQSK